jgi:hypothetical protein
MAIFERESMYQMLANRDWVALSNTLMTHAKELANDPITKQAVGFFETEFFSDCTGYPRHGCREPSPDFVGVLALRASVLVPARSACLIGSPK